MATHFNFRKKGLYVLSAVQCNKVTQIATAPIHMHLLAERKQRKQTRRCFCCTAQICVQACTHTYTFVHTYL